MRRWNKQINISTVQFQDLRHKRTSSETQEHISSNVSLPSHCSCKSFVLLIPCLSNLGFLEVTIPSTSCRVDTSIIPPCFKTSITAVTAAACAHPLWQENWNAPKTKHRFALIQEKYRIKLSYPKASRWSRKPQSQISGARAS